MAAKTDVLTKQRALVRSKITKLGNLVDSSIDSWDSLEKRKHITKAKDLQQEINYHSLILQRMERKAFNPERYNAKLNVLDYNSNTHANSTS